MNEPSIYEHMQAAVDIVSTSPHPTNKIAATIAGTDAYGKPYALSRVNFWPKPIEDTFGRTQDIGSSSGTIHAETACILSAPKAWDSSMFVTDPPCPNCMKNIAEAGISNLYIDHKGFDKDWARRRGESFANMSMRIAEKAGINVYVIYRKEQRFEVISKHIPDYTPRIEKPAHIRHCEEATPTKQSLENFWIASLSLANAECKEEPFALALCMDESGAHVILRTDRHPAVGYTSETIEGKEGKYSFILQPVNRILMIASRDGLKIEKLYSSRTPTSRELVNMIATGIDTLQIGDQTQCRDEFGLIALKQLKDAKILNIF